MEHKELNLESKVSSASGDSVNGFCSEAPQIGAAGLNQVGQGAGEFLLFGGGHSTPSILCSENLEGLTEVGTLGLQVTRKNRCGAAKKRTRKAKLAVAPTGDSDGVKTRPALGGQPRTPQRPGTSRVQQECGYTTAGLKPSETKRPNAQASGSGQTETLLRAGRPRGSNRLGNLLMPVLPGRALRVAVVSENYPESQLSKENFVDIQLAVGLLVDELPEEGFNPSLVDSYWEKGAAIMVCLDEEAKDWLASRVSALEA